MELIPKTCKNKKCTMSWKCLPDDPLIYCCKNCECQDNNIHGIEKRKVILNTQSRRSEEITRQKRICSQCNLEKDFIFKNVGRGKLKVFTDKTGSRWNSRRCPECRKEQAKKYEWYREKRT